jgi:fructokinase
VAPRRRLRGRDHRAGSAGAGDCPYSRDVTGGENSASAIARLAEQGDAEARAALARYQRRLARPLAEAINVLDPDVIVPGGGLSSIVSLYAEAPRPWAPLVLAPQPPTRLVPARFGPETCLRGAAWLGHRRKE